MVPAKYVNIRILFEQAVQQIQLLSLESVSGKPHTTFLPSHLLCICISASYSHLQARVWNFFSSCPNDPLECRCRLCELFNTYSLVFLVMQNNQQYLNFMWDNGLSQVRIWITGCRKKPGLKCRKLPIAPAKFGDQQIPYNARRDLVAPEMTCNSTGCAVL